MDALKGAEQEIETEIEDTRKEADTGDARDAGVQVSTPVLAATGSLPASVLGDLVALRNFLEGRDWTMASLFGLKLARSNLRNELIRMIVIKFGFGRLRSIAHYQRMCASLV
jgi:hypothetical protein